MLEMDIEHLLTVGVSIILASSYNVKQSCLFHLQHMAAQLIENILN